MEGTSGRIVREKFDSGGIELGVKSGEEEDWR